MDRAAFGRFAEELVAATLVERGYEIVARNVRQRRGEIDLVARRDGRLWFVETKGRKGADPRLPRRAIDARKRRALFAAATEFVRRRRFGGEWGFIAAAVTRRPGGHFVDLERIAIDPREFERCA
jgi:putative endonuclease